MNKTVTNNNFENHKLLIMTVYAPSKLNEHWYRLQKHFIKKHTLIPYDFKIITNNVDNTLFDANEVFKVNTGNIGHPAAIEQMLEYMREENSYDSYLILDSDAFPVRTGWHNILDQQMLRFNKNIAAPIRYENLDIFPHPCFVYMNKKGVNNSKVNFNYTKIKNLLGKTIDEVGGAMCLVQDDVLPLLRSNRINLHPLAAGIYHHIFYHHAAGSRWFHFRLIKDYNYCNHWIDNNTHDEFGEKLFNALIESPESFIDKLMFGY